MAKGISHHNRDHNQQRVKPGTKQPGHPSMPNLKTHTSHLPKQPNPPGSAGKKN